MASSRARTNVLMGWYRIPLRAQTLSPDGQECTAAQENKSMLESTILGGMRAGSF